MRRHIDVTPLVDVMLVLLILFMVVTPLSQKGLDVELPSAASSAAPYAVPPLVLEADERGRVTLNERPVPRDELAFVLRDALDARSEKVLFFRAHARLRYGDVVTLLDVAKRSGTERVGMLAE